MSINGVITAKLSTLDSVLVELRSLGCVTCGQLRDNWQTRRAIERDLQVLVEVVVDVCQRMLSLLNEAPASTSAEAVERCVQHGIIKRCDDYRRMVQFRNFVVHRYENVDVEILADIVNNRLGSFEQFRSEVLAHAKR